MGAISTLPQTSRSSLAEEQRLYSKVKEVNTAVLALMASLLLGLLELPFPFPICHQDAHSKWTPQRHTQE
jgi:hypothetical protein